jgi:hypothetical protein
LINTSHIINPSLSPYNTSIQKGDTMIFPTVHGSNLLRKKLTLPRDFGGKFNLVFIPFEQWQQAEVDSWVPLIGKLEQEYEGLLYYELPTLQTRSTIYRWFINEGMRAGIPNPKTRERTITLYLAKAAFQAQLDMQDEEHMYILLVDRNGNEYFRARGMYDKESETNLRSTLHKIYSQSALRRQVVRKTKK